MSDEHQWVLIEQVNTAMVVLGAELTEVRSEGQQREQAYWWIASVRFDGDVMLHRAANAPFCQSYGMPGESKRAAASAGCDTFLSVGNITELRELLALLDAKGREHFGEDWNT